MTKKGEEKDALFPFRPGRNYDIITAQRLLYFDFSPFAPALWAEPPKMEHYTIPLRFMVNSRSAVIIF